jgi:uncharacterized membrane protein
MNLYSFLVFLHVLTAVFGLGPLTVLAVASSGTAPAIPAARFMQLLRIVGVSLGVMLVTGILIIAQTHGALGKAGWVRVSFGLLLVIGALQSVVRRRVKRNMDSTLPRGLSPWMWTMCALVGAITYLMEVKPW